MEVPWVVAAVDNPTISWRVQPSILFRHSDSVPARSSPGLGRVAIGGAILDGSAKGDAVTHAGNACRLRNEDGLTDRAKKADEKADGGHGDEGSCFHNLPARLTN